MNTSNSRPDPAWGEDVPQFEGRYRFLSNFWIHPDGLTVEHHFQAAKTLNPDEAAWIRSAPSPGKAKYRGRSANLRSDWETIKDRVMADLIARKFAPGTTLASLLLATGHGQLTEGNTWGDQYWGVNLRTGRGLNLLGHILEQHRDMLRTTHHPHQGGPCS